MLTEEDYSIIGFTESMAELDRCVAEFTLSQEKMIRHAVKSWDGQQLKSAERKLHDHTVGLANLLDRSYNEIHAARRATGMKDDSERPTSIL